MLNDDDEIFEAMPDELKEAEDGSDNLDDLDGLFLDREGEFRDENDDGLDFDHE